MGNLTSQDLDERNAVVSCLLQLFALYIRYKLVDVAFLMHKLLQRVKMMKVAGGLERQVDGGEGLYEGVGGGGEVEVEKREWKLAEKEKVDMIQVINLTEK